MKLLLRMFFLLGCVASPVTSVMAQTVPDKTGHSPFLKECYAKCAGDKNATGREGCMQNCKREDTKRKKDTSTPSGGKAK